MTPTVTTARRPALILGVAASISLALLGDQMLYVVLPGQPQVAGIGIASLGVILGVNRFIRLGANGMSGVLSDRLGRRSPFLLGMLLALLSTAGYLLTSGFWPLLVARLVWGVAFALISVSGLSIALDVATAADRGRTVGLYLSLVQCGTLLGLVLSGLLVDRIGYRATLAVYVPLTALGCLVAWLTLHETAPGRAGRGTSSAPRASGSAIGRALDLDRRLIVPAYASFTSYFAGSGILMATLGMYLRQVASAGGVLMAVATLTGLLLASRRLAGMVMSPLAGYLSDRTGSRRMVAVVGTLTILAGFLVFVLAPRGLGAVVIGVALTAIGEGVLHPSLAAWVGDATPEHRRGVMMGALATVNDLGAAIGPVVGYALAAALDLDAAYALCLALTASSALVLLAVSARRASG